MNIFELVGFVVVCCFGVGLILWASGILEIKISYIKDDE